MGIHAKPVFLLLQIARIQLHEPVAGLVMQIIILQVISVYHMSKIVVSDNI
jgi:hypothetical protein